MQKPFPQLLVLSPVLLLAACSDVSLGVEKTDGGDAAAGTTTAGNGGSVSTGGIGAGSGGLSGTGGGTSGTGGKMLGTGGDSGTGGAFVGSGGISGAGGRLSGTGGIFGTGGRGSGGVSGSGGITSGTCTAAACTTDAGQSGKDVSGGEDAERTCTYNGRTYPDQTCWYALDGCNEVCCLSGSLTGTGLACADAGLRGYSCGSGITIGDTVPSTDGCNICECGFYWYRDSVAGAPGGVMVSCTFNDCSVPPVKDAGAGGDGGIDACVYNGRTYPLDTYFLSADGCEKCHCRTDGQITCTFQHVGCRGTDAGQPDRSSVDVLVAPDTPLDSAVAPGCDVAAARAAMTARGLTLTGPAETLNNTLPSPISGPNWGLKSIACQDGGYDISSLAGQTVCLVKQTIVQPCAQAPYLAWAVMSDGVVKCVYRSADSNPGIYAVDSGFTCP
jgi:hypothetical protein